MSGAVGGADQGADQEALNDDLRKVLELTVSDPDEFLETLALAGYTVVKTQDEWEYAQVGGCTEAAHCHGPHIGVAPDGQWLHSEMGTASYRRRVYRAGPWVPVPEGDDSDGK